MSEKKMSQTTTTSIPHSELEMARIAVIEGDLARAESMLNAMLKRDGQCFDALHQLAIVQIEQERFEDATRLLRQAAEVSPSSQAQYDLGRALLGLKLLDEAKACFALSVELDAENGHAYCELAHLIGETGDRRTAFEYLVKAAKNSKKDPRLLRRIGEGFIRAEKYDDAEECFKRALSIASDDPKAIIACAEYWAKGSRHREAVRYYQRALRANEQNCDAHVGLGRSLWALKRHKEALAAYGKALEIDPKRADVFLLCGNALMDAKEYDVAIPALKSAVILAPGRKDSHYMLAAALTYAGRFKEAVAAGKKALKIDPECYEANANYAAAVFCLGEFAEAERFLDKAVSLNPERPDAHYTLAICRLMRGDYTLGLKDYEYRWATHRQVGDQVLPTFRQPRASTLDQIRGKTVLVIDEQGAGDNVQMMRFVHRLAAVAKQVILQVKPPLVELARSLDCKIKVIPSGTSMPAFDVWIPLMSMPLACDTSLQTIPGDVPYLRADEKRLATFKRMLSERALTGRKLVGIVWAGNPKHINDRNRSMPLHEMLPLFKMAGITCVSLQRDVTNEDRAVLKEHGIEHYGDHIKDFADTAALCAAVDLLVCVDTVVAHIAGALGKQVLLAVAHVSDWRWMEGREDSPWYPTFKLIRQTKPGGWAGVINRVRAEIDPAQVSIFSKLLNR